MTHLLEDAGGAPRVDLMALRPGDHVCSLSPDEPSRTETAARFIRAGLAAGDRVLYVFAGRDPVSVQAALGSAGVACDRAVPTGQLLLARFEDVYCSSVVDLDALAGQFRATARQAQTDGFPGLRVAAEMGDVERSFGSMDTVFEWEERASALQAEEGITSICQYDRRRLDDAEAARVVDVHLGVASAHPVEPLADLLVSVEPWGLHIAGEVDISNKADFDRALRARLAVQPEVHLDLSGVAFMDIDSVGLIFTACREMRAVLRLVGTPRQVRRVIDVAGFESPAVFIES